MSAEPQTIDEVPSVRHPSAPYTTTKSTAAPIIGLILPDACYAENYQLCKMVFNMSKEPCPLGFRFESSTDDFVQQDLVDLVTKYLENPVTGDFLYGMICLGLAQSHESVIPNRYQYAILALQRLERFVVEYCPKTNEIFELMNDILEEVEKVLVSIKCKTESQIQELQRDLDAMAEFREGTYTQELSEEEEEIFPFSPDPHPIANPLESHFLDMQGSQKPSDTTEIEAFTDDAESLTTEDGGGVIEPGRPPQHYGKLDDYMKDLKLREDIRKTGKR